MKATRYFEEQVRRKRPYIDPEMCSAVIAAPIRRDVQGDGRIRHWGVVTDRRDGKERHMKLHYYPETDSLYVELKPEPSAETREVADGLNVDLDAKGDVVGFDIDHASRRLDLSTLETIALPVPPRVA
jgi:uncharacterized protein YuzE